MKKVSISEIKDGMVLAKPLLGSDGKILMAEGVVLKASMAMRLQNWGVILAYIEHDELKVEEQPKALEKAELLKTVEERFEDTLENINMRTLYNEVVKHIKARH